MKILNIAKSATLEEGKPVVSYVDLVKAVIESMPTGYNGQPTGVKIDEQRRRFRILDALENAKEGVMELEDADAGTLQRLVEEMPWGIVSRGIIEFCDDVAGMSNK